MTVLIVDDQKLFSDTLKKTLEHNQDNQFEVTIANSHDVVYKSLSETDFDIILMDIHMPEKDGIVLTKEIMRLYPDSKKSGYLTISIFPRSRNRLHIIRAIFMKLFD